MRYKSKTEFLDRMNVIVDAADHVRIDGDALSVFARVLKPVENKQSLWNPFIAKAGGDTLHDHLIQAFFAVAVNESQQSGCDYPDEDGQPARWEIDGSAAMAVDAKLNEMYDDGDLPTWDNDTLEPVHLKAHMAGVPNAEERIRIFNEFCQLQTRECFKRIVDRARRSDDHYEMNFDDIEDLAASLPLAFGSNEFRKKASLVPIVFASYAASKGVKVDLDVIAPTDHRLPQTLNGCGVLKFSDALIMRLNNRVPFKQDDPTLQEIRAACILVFEQLRQHVNMPVNDIDGALWMAPKNGMMEKMRAEIGLDKNLCAQRPLICYTMHF